MLPFPFSNGEDFIQVDWTGTMSAPEGMQGYLAYWYKTGRVINGWRQPAPLVRVGFLVENPEGLEFFSSGEQTFDPETGILTSEVHLSESSVIVETFLRGVVWVQAIRFLHAAPGARLCFTANQRVLFRLCSEIPLPEPPRYFVDGDSLGFSYHCSPREEPPPYRDFLPSFKGTGRLAAWADDGQIPTPQLDVPQHHLLNPPNGGLWFEARTGGFYVACATLLDNLSECGEAHENTTAEEIRVARKKGFSQLRREQEDFWRGYQKKGKVSLPGDDATTYFIQASIYGLKSGLHPHGAIPCSLFLPTLSGETYWDSWGMASGLLRFNHAEDAKRIGRFFVRCLPKAREYAKLLGAEGARLEWRLSPPPFDGVYVRPPSPQIHNDGTHLNTIWDAYSFTGDIQYLEEVFPVIEETVQFYLSYAVVQSENGIHIKPVQSLEESPMPRENEAWTLAVIIRSLEILRLAAGVLGRKTHDNYKGVEQSLRFRLQQNYANGILQSYSGCRRITLGSILPFRIFENLSGFQETLEAYCQSAVEAEGFGFGPYTHARGRIFPWAHGMIASAMNRQGTTGVWEKMLAKVPQYTDHLGGSAELWLHSRQISYPWYLGSHGFFLSGLAELFGIWRKGAYHLLGDIPSEWKNLEFENIRMDYGLLVSGAIQDGRITQLKVLNTSPTPLENLRFIIARRSQREIPRIAAGESMALKV